MPYTKTPMQSTEQTKVISFLEEWNTRNISNTKDVDNVNVIWETVTNSTSGEQYTKCIKRDGTENYLPAFPNSITNIYWAPSLLVFVVVGTFGVRIYNVGGGLIFTAAAPANLGVGFTEFLYENGQQAIAMSAVNTTWIWDRTPNTITQITDADFPVNTVGYPVFLDGYLIVASPDGNIWNSDLNTPLSWSPSNFIAAESYPDNIKAITRSGQYIVAFGDSSIQFFYDAANPTGTPLGAQTTVIKVGYVGGMCSFGDTVYFLGQPIGGKPLLYKLDGLKAVPVVDYPYVRRQEDFSTTIGGAQNINGFILNINGHALYTAIDNKTTASLINNTTYAYDLTSDLWSRLTFGNTGLFSIFAAQTVKTENVYKTVMLPSGNVTPSQQLIAFNPSIYQDSGVNFPVQFRTKNLDFGTRREKFGMRVLVNCDQATATSNMQLSYTVDDYQTYSPVRNINLASMYPVTYALGKFKKIAFLCTYSDNFPMRWENLELDYDQGTA